MLALMLILAQAAPETGTTFNAGRALNAIARSGDLMIVGTENVGTGRNTPVLEASINRCIVTLKTKVELTGFTAKVVELGEGSVIEPVPGNKVRLLSAPLKGELILHSTSSIKDVLKALASTRSSCQDEQGIF